MARAGTAQEKYRRNAERYESDLTDGEWAVTGPPVPPPDNRSPRDPERDPVHSGDGMPVAGGSRVFPAIHDGPGPFPPLARPMAQYG